MGNMENQSRSMRQQKVDRLLAELPTMDRKSLQQLWRDIFDRKPDRTLRRETLIPVLAYGLQEKAYGGLKKSLASKLRELIEERAGGAKHAHTSLRPKIGTRYVREYRGKLHEVTVLESGYEYEGEAHRSLTEVAKVITGTKRSGPVFFGLKNRVRMTLV